MAALNVLSTGLKFAGGDYLGGAAGVAKVAGGYVYPQCSAEE